MNTPPPPPKPPPCRILKEGDILPKCKSCGSSLHTGPWEWQIFSWFWFDKNENRGCIQPECENYYDRSED